MLVSASFIVLYNFIKKVLAFKVFNFFYNLFYNKTNLTVYIVLAKKTVEKLS